MNLEETDKQVFQLLEKEKERQTEGLELIPSESYASKAVLDAVGSVFSNKYAENYPGKRYYGGCVNVDELERLCQKRALELFNLPKEEWSVNVQPYSGSPANLEVYFGLLEFGDTIMAMDLSNGGHLTHGSPVNFSGKTYNFVPYGVDPETEVIDYDEVEKLAKKHKPKLILSGFTAYPRTIDFQKFHDIAKSVGAISMADISHISGLIAVGAHPSPFSFTDVVTTTTHKTLRGPRGAMIYSKKEYQEAIDRAVFPGMQGGPHENTIAGIAVAVEEAKKDEFREYANQIVPNTHALVEALIANGIKIVSGGSDNHLALIDLRPFGNGRGIFVEKALEASDISVNKSSIPNDPSPPYYPSGIRLGTPAVTSRGMREKEMKETGEIIARICHEFAKLSLPDDKEERLKVLRDFKKTIKDHPLVIESKEQVNKMARQFPVPGIDS